MCSVCARMCVDFSILYAQCDCLHHAYTTAHTRVCWQTLITCLCSCVTFVPALSAMLTPNCNGSARDDASPTSSRPQVPDTAPCIAGPPMAVRVMTQPNFFTPAGARHCSLHCWPPYGSARNDTAQISHTRRCQTLAVYTLCPPSLVCWRPIGMTAHGVSYWGSQVCVCARVCVRVCVCVRACGGIGCWVGIVCICVSVLDTI